ncbi:pentapeptide repeat-containing protein [Pseudoalteromonas sp. MMG022]|uniref:phosphorylase family protein n=1 Tax=Pseudoalteromonas sp. MMG022 TaxID=2909978 RepID=UPI001F2EF0A2|nr:pentapeptide repeat-containing protein [Pseudoalteromonas sp. MMG022]MCF6437232.1 pentapeptide repeat-containing protein [Pseudoalteromonas sp. MMG022]
MPILKPTLARNAVDKIRGALKPAFAKKIDELLDILSPEGTVQVADIHEHLFVFNTSASANASLNRLISQLNEKFEEQGSSVSLEITADKKLAGKREVWFEAQQTELPKPYTKELDSIAEAVLTTDQQATFVDKADIVLLTFNEHELQQCLLEFGCNGAEQGLVKKDRLYYRLGLVSGHKVVLLHSAQATIGALQSAEAAIAAWQPKAVIAVGIAFGINKAKQNVGDVLVSEYLIPYELARVNPDGSSLLRGARPAASHKLLTAFKQLHHHLLASKAHDFPELRFGGMFTGDKLIDSAGFLNDLKGHAPEAIGGEMEGTGLYTAAARANLDWIVVKAICDFADGHKNSGSKEQDQALAARHAAKVVKEALALCSPYPNKPDGEFPHEKPEADIGPDRFEALCHDLNNTDFTVDDALAVQTSLNKAELHRVDETPRIGETSKVGGMPLQQALMEWVFRDDKDAFALLGEYGMGKTINCQMFDQAMRKAHQDDKNYPVSLYFDLRHVENLSDAKVPNIEKIIEDCVQYGWFGTEDHSKFTLLDIERWAKQFGVLLIFDGLDEVLVKLTDNGGQRFTNQLFKFLTDLKQRLPEQNIKMLLSCRTQYFPSLHQQIDHFTNSERGGYKTDRIEAMILLPFNEQQIITYLRHSLPGLDPDDILAMIASVHDLTDLSKRPYTLKLVSELIPQIEQKRKLGESVSGVGLYQMMVDRWLDRDDGKHHINPAHKKLLASHLAAFLWHKGQRALPATDIQDWFHQWLVEQPSLVARYGKISPELLEEDLRTATFLSRDDRKSDSRFRFAHTSLQEFFLANYLLHAIETERPALWAMSQPSQETLAFLAQLLAEPNNKHLLQTLSGWKREYRPQVSENILHFALLSQRLGFTPPNLAGINLTGANLDDLEITPDTELSLVNADFSGASLRRVKFANLVMHRAKFTHANLTQASFEHCQLVGSNFNDANLTSCMFYRSNMQSVDLEGANTRHTQQYYCAPHLMPTIFNGQKHPRVLLGLANKQIAVSGHVEHVKDSAALGDGVTIVTASYDGTLRVWNSQTGECLKVLQGHPSGVLACTVLGDGITIVSVSHNGGELRLLDGQSGKCLKVIQGSEKPVVDCALLSDGITLVSADYNGTLRRWNTNTGECSNMLELGLLGVFGCSVLGDDKRIVLYSADYGLRIWDCETGECLQKLVAHSDMVQTCAVLGDGQTIISASSDHTLRLWDSQTGVCLQTIDVETTIYSISVLGDGVTVACCGRYGVELWNTNTGECVRKLNGDSCSIINCTVSKDGKTLVTLNADGTARVWDSEQGACLTTLGEDFRDNTHYIRLSDHLIAACYREHSIRILDTRTGIFGRCMAGHKGDVWDCKLLDDEVTLVSASEDGTLRVWNSQTGECLRVLAGHERAVNDFVIIDDGATIVSTSNDGTLRLWDRCSGECINLLNAGDTLSKGLIVLGDRKTLVSIHEGYLLAVCDSSSAECLRAFKGDILGINSLAVLGDGVTLVSANRNKKLQLWNSRTGECMLTLSGHEAGVNDCVVLGDGVTIVSVSRDSTMRIWDSKTGECLKVVDEFGERLSRCFVQSDGKTVVLASEHGHLYYWDTSTDEHLRTLYALPDFGFVDWDVKNARATAASDNAWRYMTYQVELDGKSTSVPFFMPDEATKQLAS